MSQPSSRIRPSSGVSKPASIRSSVVLPQPDGPSSAKNSPARMSSDSRSTARKPPNFFTTASMRSSGMSAAGLGLRRGPCRLRHRLEARFGFRLFVSHVPRRPDRGRTLAADRQRLNPAVLCIRRRRSPPCHPLRAERKHEPGQIRSAADDRIGPRRGILSRRRRLHAVGLERRRRRLRPRHCRGSRLCAAATWRGRASIR